MFHPDVFDFADAVVFLDAEDKDLPFVDLDLALTFLTSIDLDLAFTFFATLFWSVMVVSRRRSGRPICTMWFSHDLISFL